MRLSDYFSCDNIIRDTEFDALGLSNSTPGARFLSFMDDEKYTEELLRNPQIVAIICKDSDADELMNKTHWGIVTADEPRRVYFELHNRLAEDPSYRLTLKKTTVGKDCKISKLASIAESGVSIGDHVVIDDFVKIEGPCKIGDHTVIHSGCIIGGKGYEFKRYADSVLDVTHCGGVLIKSHVELWENVSIHRAVYPWDNTIIESWARIGAHTHVDHGTLIDAFAEICAGCIISGRVTIGDHAFIGPGSIVSNRVSVGDNARVLIGSVVTKDVPADMTVSGNFAIDHKKHLNTVINDSYTEK